MEIKFDMEGMIQLAESAGLEVKLYNDEVTYRHQDMWVFIDDEEGIPAYFIYPHGEWTGNASDIPGYEKYRLVDYHEDCTVQVLSNEEGDVSVGWY